MTFYKTWIAAGLALAIGAAPALAADWGGGIKDMGGGLPVPVPAPVPVPTYDYDSNWYVGLGIGGNIFQDANITDSDPNMPVKDSSDLAISPTFGLDFGRYITPSLRAEIAIDYTPNTRLTSSGNLLYQETVTAPAVGGGTDSRAYGIVRQDSVELSRTTGLFNLIYDIHTGTAFTPYIGGGAGFSWRKLRRSYTETANCGPTPEFPANVCNVVSNAALPPNQTVSGSSVNERIDFAAAVQAGIAYDINEWVTWDNGWQMLWEGGAIASSSDSISGTNTITYKDSVLQQFRSGIRLRFN